MELVPDGSVRKTTVRAGQSGRTPPNGATVFVSFVGRVGGADGEVFYSTHERGHFFSFTIGQEQTIPGLELAVAQMTEGETALISVAPSQAYGPMGNQQGFHGSGHPIPANATLQFELQLLDWDEDPDKTRLLGYAGKMEFATRAKTEGNALFAQPSEVVRAVCKYKRAIACLDDNNDYDVTARTDEEKQTQQALVSTCHLNLAACLLKLAQYKEAAESCRSVLEGDKNNVKARFRLAKALVGTNDLEEAKRELEQALALGESGEIRKELVSVEQKLRAQERKQQQFYGKLFNKMGAEKKDAGLGLYTPEELAEAKKPALKKCNICGEEVEEVQLARHVIKKHNN